MHRDRAVVVHRSREPDRQPLAETGVDLDLRELFRRQGARDGLGDLAAEREQDAEDEEGPVNEGCRASKQESLRLFDR